MRARRRARGELRLAPVRGARALRGGRVGARPRPAGDRAQARRRQLLDHGRRRRARPARCRPARPLRVRRLLQGPRRVGAALARPRARRAADVAQGLQPVVVRRGRPGPRVRGLARRPGLPDRRRADGDGGAARPGGEPLALHAERDEHLGRGPRSRLGRRPGPGARRAPRRGRGRGGRARRRRRDRAHPRPPRPCRGAGRAARAARRPAGRRDAARCATATRSARSPRCTCPAMRPTTSCSSPAARRSPATRCSARGASSSPRAAGRWAPTSTGCGGCARSALERLHPGHGPVVEDPAAKLDEYIAHRLERERRIVAALDAGARTEDELLAAAWDDVPEGLRLPAAWTLQAHLEKLREEGRLPGRDSDDAGAQAGARRLGSSRRRASSCAAASGVVPAASAMANTVRSVSPIASTRARARSGE